MRDGDGDSNIAFSRQFLFYLKKTEQEEKKPDKRSSLLPLPKK